MKRNISLKEKTKGPVFPRKVRPVVDPDFAVVSTEVDNGEKIAVRVEVLERPLECSCRDYEGQDYFCRVHTPKVECPGCCCVGAEIIVPDELPSIIHYRCTVCGVFYMRGTEDGKYIFSR